MRNLIIVFVLLPLLSHSQKFMIEYKGDTVPYQVKMVVRGNDTTYEGSCNTFELKGNKIINREINCVPYGYWEIAKKDSTISKGYYNSSGHLTGVWKTYDKDSKLIKEEEYVSVGNDEYVVKTIDYENGVGKVVTEKTWFAIFYLKHVLVIAIIILGAFFTRFFLNMIILEKEYGITASGKFSYKIETMFKLWWSNLNPENKTLGLASNILTIISIGGFFTILIGLAISGELH